MNFAPRPENDFRSFIRTYFERCRDAFPRIIAIAGKWAFADLIPGMSDFDTRFIVNGPMSADDWTTMAMAVSEVHTKLARDVPVWARNLEHLPGLNFTLDEMLDPVLYYPEFKLWSFYDGDIAAINSIQNALKERVWGVRDELYHLKRIATFIGPYQRGIDPPINLGRFESKYPLHSRYMHYFAPPVQSAVALMKKQHVRGKLESLRCARAMFAEGQTIGMVLDAVDRHYEIPQAYEEPRLTRIEEELEAFLDQMWQQLAAHVGLVRIEPGDDVKTIRRKVAAVPSDPVSAFSEGVKFSRLMKGRLHFYAQKIPWFDSTRLIQIELGLILPNLIDKPLTLFVRLRFGEQLSRDDAISRLSPDPLTPAQVDALHRFVTAASEPLASGHEKEQAIEVARVYGPVLAILEDLSNELRSIVNCH